MAAQQAAVAGVLGVGGLAYLASQRRAVQERADAERVRTEAARREQEWDAERGADDSEHTMRHLMGGYLRYARLGKMYQRDEEIEQILGILASLKERLAQLEEGSLASGGLRLPGLPDGGGGPANANAVLAGVLFLLTSKKDYLFKQLFFDERLFENVLEVGHPANLGFSMAQLDRGSAAAVAGVLMDVLGKYSSMFEKYSPKGDGPDESPPSASASDDGTAPAASAGGSASTKTDDKKPTWTPSRQSKKKKQRTAASGDPPQSLEQTRQHLTIASTVLARNRDHAENDFIGLLCIPTPTFRIFFFDPKSNEILFKALDGDEGEQAFVYDVPLSVSERVARRNSTQKRGVVRTSKDPSTPKCTIDDLQELCTRSGLFCHLGFRPAMTRIAGDGDFRGDFANGRKLNMAFLGSSCDIHMVLVRAKTAGALEGSKEIQESFRDEDGRKCIRFCTEIDSVRGLRCLVVSNFAVPESANYVWSFAGSLSSTSSRKCNGIAFCRFWGPSMDPNIDFIVSQELCVQRNDKPSEQVIESREKDVVGFSAAIRVRVQMRRLVETVVARLACVSFSSSFFSGNHEDNLARMHQWLGGRACLVSGSVRDTTDSREQEKVRAKLEENLEGAGLEHLQAVAGAATLRGKVLMNFEKWQKEEAKLVSSAKFQAAIQKRLERRLLPYVEFLWEEGLLDGRGNHTTTSRCKNFFTQIFELLGFFASRDVRERDRQTAQLRTDIAEFVDLWARLLRVANLHTPTWQGRIPEHLVPKKSIHAEAYKGLLMTLEEPDILRQVVLQSLCTFRCWRFLRRRYGVNNVASVALARNMTTTVSSLNE